MKKMITILLLIAVACAVLAFPAMADQTPQMTITASESTLHRGDTVTITVSISETPGCSAVGLGMVYDEAVFEMVENSYELLVSNTSRDSFGYNNNAKGYVALIMMAGNQTVKGDLFRFSLKVKDDVLPNQEVKISGTPNLRVNNAVANCEVVDADLTIACNHEYGPWTEADGESHVHTCSICGHEWFEQHDWSDGEVQVQPDCTTEGSLLQTCNDCNATRTETMDSLGHDPADAVEENRKEATCEEDGSYELVVYCKRCKVELSREQKTISAAGHKYDHDCDTTCNVCAAERSTIHKYDTKYSSDGQNHWYACKVCGDHGAEEAHTPGAAATEWDPQVCTKCGYVLQEALGHTHEYGETYVYDDNTHWLICDGCSEKGSEGEHEFDNDCDEDCNVCGYSRQVEHDYSKRLSFNEEGHWYGCNICGDVLELIPHNPGPEATETEDQTCQDCGYVIVPAGSHEHSPTGDWLSNEEGHWHECACGEKLDSGKHLWGSGSVDSETNTVIYRCSVCGYPRVESNGAPNQPTDPETPSEPGEEPTDPEEPTEKPTQPGNNPNDNQQKISPWIYVIAAVALLIFGGVLFILIGILSSRKQSGRFSR